MLLAGTASLVSAETVAESRIVPGADGAVTWIVIGEAAPIPSEDNVQTTELVPEQLQPEPPAEEKTTPEGSVSVTESALAWEGPALATFSV